MTQDKDDKAASVSLKRHCNIPFLYRKQLKLQLKAAITKAYAGGYASFYRGCAMGFDMLAAEVALRCSPNCHARVIAVESYRGTTDVVERCDESPVWYYFSVTGWMLSSWANTTTMAVCFDATTIWFFHSSFYCLVVTATPRRVMF